MLVEFGVLAKRDHVAQQRFAVDGLAAVADLHAGPVGLAGHRAVGLEQARAQGFLDHVAGARAQQLGRRFVGVDLDVELVYIDTVQFAHPQLAEALRQDEVQPHGGAGGGAQVALQAAAQGGRVDQPGLVERVQVQLERLGLDDVGAVGRHRERRHRHPRLALGVEPGQLVGVPQIDPGERQGPGRQVERLAVVGAGDGKQQRGIVLRDVGHALAQRAVRQRHGEGRRKTWR